MTLPVDDPDGDSVRCRWALPSECAGACTDVPEYTIWLNKVLQSDKFAEDKLLPNGFFPNKGSMYIRNWFKFFPNQGTMHTWNWFTIPQQRGSQTDVTN